MSESMQQPGEGLGAPENADQYVVVGPEGPVATEGGEEDQHSLTDLVEQPAKVMRIGTMIRQLLEEVKAAPVDEAGRTRLAAVLHTSLEELKDGLAPELDEELNRLVQPFEETTPSESELRIAQAQLVGWLEGLFQGIQTAIYAQQMAARAQLEQMRRQLPPGMGGTAQPEEQEASQQRGASGMGAGGMYL